jgi:hypothetical protein
MTSRFNQLVNETINISDVNGLDDALDSIKASSINQIELDFEIAARVAGDQALQTQVTDNLNLINTNQTAAQERFLPGVKFSQDLTGPYQTFENNSRRLVINAFDANVIYTRIDFKIPALGISSVELKAINSVNYAGVRFGIEGALDTIQANAIPTININDTFKLELDTDLKIYQNNVLIETRTNTLSDSVFNFFITSQNFFPYEITFDINSATLEGVDVNGELKVQPNYQYSLNITDGTTDIIKINTIDQNIDIGYDLTAATINTLTSDRIALTNPNSTSYLNWDTLTNATQENYGIVKGNNSTSLATKILGIENLELKLINPPSEIRADDIVYQTKYPYNLQQAGSINIDPLTNIVTKPSNTSRGGVVLTDNGQPFATSDYVRVSFSVEVFAGAGLSVFIVDPAIGLGTNYGSFTFQSGAIVTFAPTTVTVVISNNTVYSYVNNSLTTTPLTTALDPTGFTIHLADSSTQLSQFQLTLYREIYVNNGPNNSTDEAQSNLSGPAVSDNSLVEVTNDGNITLEAENEQIVDTANVNPELKLISGDFIVSAVNRKTDTLNLHQNAWVECEGDVIFNGPDNSNLISNMNFEISSERLGIKNTLNFGNTYESTITSNLTQDRTVILPDKDGYLKIIGQVQEFDNNSVSFNILKSTEVVLADPATLGLVLILPLLADYDESVIHLYVFDQNGNGSNSRDIALIASGSDVLINAPVRINSSFGNKHLIGLSGEWRVVT